MFWAVLKPQRGGGGSFFLFERYCLEEADMGPRKDSPPVNRKGSAGMYLSSRRLVAVLP